MKAILPTLKQKKRYLAYEIISDRQPIGYDEAKLAIIEGFFKFMGELGVAEAGIQTLDDCYDQNKQRGLIKVGHTHVDKLRASLCSIERIGKSPVSIKTIGMSGIMKKAQERYIFSGR